MEKYLFGIIAVLLLVIAGTGLYAAVSHPETTANIPGAAVAAVGEALQDATGTLTESSATKADANMQSSDETQASETNNTSQTSNSQTSQRPGTYTMAQVQTHNSASSCYTTINGAVYDLTSFINQHPGGEGAILSLCGTDGTAAFENQHGGQRRPESELASLKIGTLTQ